MGYAKVPDHLPLALLPPPSADLPVQPRLQKYFCSLFGQITS
jgi:hypothetical protein